MRPECGNRHELAPDLVGFVSGGCDMKTGSTNFEVYEVSSTGALGKLLARLSVFDDAKAVAELPTIKSRVVVHFGEIVWPKPPVRIEKANTV